MADKNKIDHKEDSKRAAKNSLFLYLRMLIMMFVTLYTSRVIFDVLGVTDFGIYNVVAGVVAFLGFFTSSLSNASQRYISFGLADNDPALTRRYFNQSLSLYAGFAILVLLLGETIGVWFVSNKLNIPAGSENAAFWAFQFALLTSIISIMQIPYISVIIARERMSIYAYIGLFEAFSKLGCAYLLLTISDTDRLILYSALLTACTLLYTLGYYFYCRQFNETRFLWVWDKSLIKDMGRFIKYSLFGCFAYAVGTQGINIVLNIFFGPVVNASRGIALQVSATIVRFTESIFTAIKPQITKSYASGDHGYLHTLIHKGSVYSCIFMFMLATPILFNINTVLSLWLKNVPQYAGTFTILVIIDALIWTLQYPLALAANATGDLRRCQVKGRLFILASLPLSYIALKLCHYPTMPFYILIAMSVLYTLYCLYDIHMQLNLKYSRYMHSVIGPICKTLLPTLCAVTLETYFLNPGILRICIVTLTDLVLTLYFAFYFALSREERIFVIKRLKHIRN